MIVTRYCVEWMTKVPEDIEADECRYDRAEWDSRTFDGSNLERARELAQHIANSNDWGQAWLYCDHAPSYRSPEWQWERDHDATEIFETESA